MVLSDAHAQDSGPGAEEQRRLELHRLAVDARRHRAVRVDLEARSGPLPPRPPLEPAVLPAPGAGAHHGDPEHTVIDPWAGARAHGTAQAVAVVGDEDGGTRVVLVSARPAPAEVELVSVRPEHVGHGVEQCAQLRVAIARALYRLGVEAERDVVHEHLPVHLGQVNPALAAIHERVERANDVVAVDAEVEREVVAASRRHAGVRQTVPAAIAATIA